MKLMIANAVFGLIYWFSATDAFSPISNQKLSVVLNTRSNGSSALHVNLPRLDLPDAVTDKLIDFDLKNPNVMNEEEYRSYAGAAIAGTLLFFLLPGALLTGIYNDLGSVAIAFVADFLLSALIGGGVLIYLSLRNDSIGEQVREYGFKLLSTVKDATGIKTIRFNIPDTITDVMTGQLDLLDPNSMKEKDYDGYSGAAVAGTLGFFVLPGAIAIGVPDILGGFAGLLIVNFLFSTLIGGGLSIYLSLRNDEIGATVNQAGTKLLDAVDDVIG
mmetsp:Transcript_6450/g.7431  ORF Transcript_6450/g.7431 Transcript_6450/m.7431 type:complete len:273 (+) Transcript_6450:100-918(+)